MSAGDQTPSWRRQSSQLSGDGSPGVTSAAGDEVSAPPAPPPPPPPFPGAAATAAAAATTVPTAGTLPPPPPPPPPGHGRPPAVRLSTEIQEPPAAIQNAMMTKDKKPFTYTPGGLDLSQIRSPRMQRRIVRNAANEGVGGENTVQPKASSITQGNSAPLPLPPSALAAMQPALPVPVFPPAGIPPQATAAAPPPPPPPPQQQPQHQPPRAVSPVVSPSPSVPAAAVPASPISPPPAPAAQTRPNEPGSIYVPPVAPPAERRSQVGSLYIPPVTQQQQQPPQVMSPGPMSPLTLNKAPTPWLTQRQQQTQPSVPPWAQPRVAPQRPPSQHEQQQQQQHQQSPPPPPPPQQPQQQTPGTRIIPIQIEGRDPVRAAAALSPQPYNRPQAYQQQQQAAVPAPSNSQLPPGTRIIPIQIEGTEPQQRASPQTQAQNVQQRKPVYVHNKFNPQTPPPPTPESGPSQSPGHLQHQHSWGAQSPAPIQSRSFRVLQKITDTDKTEEDSTYQQNQWSPQSTQNVPAHELRKLQLSEDDRALMNKFKAQVDEDSFLHNESDPRYRGPSIPSRAFRMLQNMTDGAGAVQHQVPQAGGTMHGQHMQMAHHQPGTDIAPQPYVPPSEQQVPEPRKYVGGSIPSRSFRMLQAMTASPDNCDPGVSEL